MNKCAVQCNKSLQCGECIDAVMLFVFPAVSNTNTNSRSFVFFFIFILCLIFETLFFASNNKNMNALRGHMVLLLDFGWRTTNSEYDIEIRACVDSIYSISSVRLAVCCTFIRLSSFIWWKNHHLHDCM